MDPASLRIRDVTVGSYYVKESIKQKTIWAYLKKSLAKKKYGCIFKKILQKDFGRKKWNVQSC